MEPGIKVNVGPKAAVTTAIIIAMKSIGGFVTIVGGDFLNPSIALAKKSKHNSDSSDEPSSSSSPSATDISGSINDGRFSAGYREGNAQGRSDAISDSNNQFCGDDHSDSYCAGYNSGYRIGHGLQNILHDR